MKKMYLGFSSKCDNGKVLRINPLSRLRKQAGVLFFLFALLGWQGAMGQVATNGGSGLAGTYGSLAAAITALNGATITSPVTITVTGNQTAPVGGYSITAIGTSTNTITITGSSSTITAFTPQATGSLNDAIFKIVGGDYITIQNFTMRENTSNTVNTPAASNTMTEFGVAFLYASLTNGAQNNTIQNNTISLNRTYLNTFGIYSSTRHSATAVTTTAEVTSAAGANSFNKVYGNAISNVNFGIVFIGAGTTIAAIDNGNDIGGTSSSTGNIITNWGGGAALSAYVSLTGSNYCIFDNQQINDNVSYNIITSASLTNSNTTGGFLKNYSVASPTSGTITTTINNNTVTVTNNPSAAATGAVIGINSQGLTALLSTATFSMNNNTVQNCVLGGSTSTTNGLTCITNLSLPGTLNITGNSLINNAITATSATTGTLAGITNSGAAGTVNINSNILRSLSSSAASGQMQGIVNSGAIVTALNVNNNQFGNSTSGYFSSTVASSGTLFGFVSSGGAATCALTVQSNDFRGISYSNASTSSPQTYITNSAATLSQNISSNTFTNLSVNTTGNVTFISNSVALSATGTQTVSSNSIVTGFNKTGAGGTITLFTSNGSSVTGSTVTQSNNNFSNITVTGATTIAGWVNTDGALTTSAAVKTIQNNTFSNWTGGTNAITVMSLNFYGGASVISSNTISTITGQGAITGITNGTSGTGSTSVTFNANSITGLSSTGTGGSVLAFVCSTPAPIVNIFSNTINTLSSTGASSTVAGIQFSGAATTVNIYSNTINTLSGSGATSPIVRGILVSAGTTVNIFKNKIYDLSESGAITTTSGAVNGIILSGGATVNAYNNLIGDLRTPVAGLTDAIRGIAVTSTTATSNYNLYYNTIYLNASSTGTNFGTTGIYHTANSTSTTAKLDLRNNIVVNLSTPNGTGITSALFRSAAATYANWASTSNNNLLVAGTLGANNAILNDNGTVYPTAASSFAFSNYKSTISLDAASFTSEAGFTYSTPGSFFISLTGTNSNFLHVVGGITTQVESGAGVISSPSITDDFDGQTRNATTPDIGADEFTGVPQDFSPPTIAYTPLANSCTVGTRTLTATITDGSGVPTSGSGLPVLYWKINSGTYNSNIATSLGSSQYSFTLGTGSVTGDVISYYVVAQDLASTPNVGATPSSGATGFTTSPPSVSTAPTSPSTYTHPISLSGTYTVGTSGNYATITAALADLNAKCVGGPIVFSLIDANYSSGETFPIVINANSGLSSTNTLTIKPATGVTASISGSSTSSIIKIVGADYVTIDGSNSGGTDKSLTISNTNAGTSSGVIWVSSASASDGATNNTIKNTIITGNASITTLYGIYSGSSTISVAAAFANSNNTFSNNTINTVQNAIYINGYATSNDANNTVTGNLLGSSTTANKLGLRGIYVVNQTNLAVSSNTIFGVNTSDIVTSSGIYVGGIISGGSISGNKISDIKNTNTGAYGCNGIDLQSSTAATGLLISNNFIWDVASYGFASNTEEDNGYGLIVVSGGGYKVYGNTVALTTSQTDATGWPAALNITTGAITVDIKNNIFSNKQTGTYPFAVLAPIDASTAATVFSGNGGIDYNDYYSVTSNRLALTGTGLLFQTNVAGIATALTGNTHSVNVAPAFVSTADLHLTSGSNSGLKIATDLTATIATDIDGDTRTSNGFAGADEIAPVITSISPSVLCVGSNVTITGTNLSSTSAASVGGTAATTIVSASATQVVATVGNGTTGTVAVTTGNGAATSAATLTVNIPATGTIVFSPASGSANSQILITGTGLTGATNVKFGSTSASFTVDNATQITATVPSIAAGSYSISFIDACGNLVTATGSFIVTVPIPCAVPDAQPTNFVASSGYPTATALNASFTPSVGTSPSGYLVVRSTAALSTDPQDGTTYTVGSTFGGGTVIQSALSSSVSLTGLTGNTGYIITVFAYNSGGCTGTNPVYLTDDPLVYNFTTCPAPPTSVSATPTSNTNGNSVAFAWTASSGGSKNANSYYIEIATDAAFASPISGSPFVSSSTSSTVSNLNISTTYYYRIKANNGCASTGVTGTFATSCGTITALPFSENFDVTSNINSSTNLPNCWSFIDNNADGFRWLVTQPFTSSNAFSGLYTLRYRNNSTNITITADDWAFTPSVSLVGGTSYTLSFYQAAGFSTSINSLVVHYGTTASVAGMGSNIIYANGSISNTTPSLVTTNFTAPSSGIYYLGFRCNSAANKFELNLDNVKLEVTPSAPTTPTNLTFSAIGSSSIGVNWTDNATTETG